MAFLCHKLKGGGCYFGQSLLYETLAELLPVINTLLMSLSAGHGYMHVSGETNFPYTVLS